MKTRFFSIVLLFSFFMGISGLLSGCNVIGEQGNGKVVKQDRKVSSFTAVDVSGAFEIVLTQGETETVTVEADENLLPLIRTIVEGNELRIDTKDRPIHHVTVMKVYVTIKDLKKIDISGAVDIKTTNQMKLNELNMDASGASKSRLDIAVQKLTLDCSGASKMHFTGMAVDVRMDLSGASNIFAFDFPAETYSIDLSGAGKAQINVTKSLYVEVSGAGDVAYKGNPSQVDQNVSGAGSIRKEN